MTLSTRLQKFTLALLWLTLKLFEQSAKFAYRQVMASRQNPAFIHVCEARIAPIPVSPTETIINVMPVAVEAAVPIDVESPRGWAVIEGDFAVEASLPVDVAPLASHLPSSPSVEPITATLLTPPNRATLVSALLDEAWAQGRRTYPQLIDYVREQSGTGCRRQTIKDWKVSRGLMNAQSTQAEAS